MTSLHKNQVKFNSNITISHTGGQLSSDSGLVLVKELMNIFGFLNWLSNTFTLKTNERILLMTTYPYLSSSLCN